jgi:hypothetical protein
MTRRFLTLSVLCAAGLLALTSTASALDPQSFAQVSSGIVQVKAHCPDGVVLGSGFLVGTSVVMTAHHVVAGCHGVTVLTKSTKWVPVTTITNWRDGASRLDITTMKLARAVPNAWVFTLRASQVPIGAYVAALGYPLGEGISETNGRVVARVSGQHIAVRALVAQGYSGGPIVDAFGQVVGVINFGYLSSGALSGAGVGDNVFAYDISSRWGAWRRTLCHAYKNGGIEDCPGGSGSGGSASSPSPPAPTPPPPPPPPTTTTVSTPAPSPSPPPPSPSGYRLWSGAGTYAAGTVSYAIASSCQAAAYSDGCWAVNVITTTGCNSGLFVDVNIYDGNGVLIDTGIDEAPQVVPNQVAFLEGSTFVTGAASFEVTSISCFNF